MSLKLCCALPVTLNCLKSARILFSASEYVNFGRNSLKSSNFCSALLQARWLSTVSNKTDFIKKNEKQKNSIKRVYYGPLAAHVRAVKLFSLSSSIVGLTVQPILYKEIIATANVPIILAAYSFIGFFTVVTPLLLHIITKKYIMELNYNEDRDTYIAKTLNFFCATKEVEFKVEDVFVPDVPGMFVTFHVKGTPLFIDPRHFDQPEHYSKLMGFDKPMDFKLYNNEIAKTEGTPSSNTTSSSSNK